VPASDVGALLLIAAVWVSPAAGDEGLVFSNNRHATETALAAGASGAPLVGDVLAAGEPENPYYRPPSRPPSTSG
jgi:5,6,7,8-tetrahydromethanopterin hydro-lyase